MSPDDLRTRNVKHFERVLARTSDPDERARIERLIEEERAKPDTAYPQAHDLPISMAVPQPPESRPKD